LISIRTCALTAIPIERKDPALAWELHKKATAVGEQPPELAFNLGLLLQDTGDEAAAAECYQSAVATKPDFPQALLNLGHALRATGREDEARQARSQAAVADPELAEQYFNQTCFDPWVVPGGSRTMHFSSDSAPSLFWPF
jgi:tetratricopeptide (TPR) repeat protein